MSVHPVERLVRQALDAHALPPAMRDQAEAVIEGRFAVYRAHPDWCVPELPRRSVRALGGPASLGDQLAAACILFNAAADVIDDAQDDELDKNPAWRGWGWDWRQAIDTGLWLLFLSQQALLRIPAPPGVTQAWVACFMEAGLALTAGQHVDLQAGPDAPLSEAELLELAAQKAGAAVGAFMSLGAIWAGRPDVATWQALGVKLGQILQVVTDAVPYLSARPHGDLAAAKLTLPLHYARDADPSLRTLWAEGLPLDEARQVRLQRRVAASGAVSYTQMWVGMLQADARALLARLDCPALEREIAPLFALQALDDALGLSI